MANTKVSLRVLLVGYMYGRGGIQCHTHWLAKGLTELGHDVEVLTPTPMKGHSAELLYPASYRVHTYGGGVSLGVVSSIAKVVAQGRFDVALVCGTGWNAMLGILLNWRLGKRVFFEVMSGKRGRRFDPRDLVRLGFDAVVGQAPAVEATFCEEFRWAGCHTAIPALPDPLELKANIAVPCLSVAHGIRAAYFGRLVPHKGVGFLIQNWEELSQYVDALDIYGTGEQREELESLVRHKRLASRIRLCGAYPDGEEYVRLIQTYHINLLPTTGQEGAPLVLLESMACGVPFVANGVGGIPAYANRDCEITSGNIAEFIPCVQRCCERLVTGDIDPRRLQAHYIENFSYKVLCQKWSQFLGALCRS